MKQKIELNGAHRSSNIELLKIIAIFLIIISHFTQTLGGSNSELMTTNEYVINISSSTSDVKILILSFFRYFGSIGNSIFFVCSAWFLVDSEKKNNKKVLNMLLDVWLISVLILCAVYPDKGTDIHNSLIMKCLLPTTFSNNWYITLYIIIYLIYPGLNKLLRQLSQKTHLTAILIAIILASVYIPVFREWGAYLYVNQFVMWIIVYFVVAYVKWYMPLFNNSIKKNLLLLILSVCGIIFGIMLFNYLGIHHEFFNNRILNFNNPQNLFILVLSISALNLFRQINIQSSFINSISKLSLLIYIIHENILLRQYYRPLVFIRLHDTFGYAHVIGWLILLALITFIASSIIALIYSKTFQKLTHKAADILHPLICSKWNKLLDRMIGKPTSSTKNG